MRIVIGALSFDSRGGPVSAFAEIHKKSHIPQWGEDGASRGLTIAYILSGEIATIQPSMEQNLERSPQS
jgi:hypothetical protein